MLCFSALPAGGDAGKLQREPKGERAKLALGRAEARCRPGGQ